MISAAGLVSHFVLTFRHSYQGRHSPPTDALWLQPSAETAAQPADSQLGSAPTVPSTLGSFCPSSPWMAFARRSSPTTASLSALQANVFGRSSPPSCHLCPWNPCPCSCSCFASSPSRGDRIFRTCGTSCHRACLQRVYLHRCCARVIGSTTHLVSPSHARHPQALDERGPTSGISQNSTTSVSRALCLSLKSGTIPTRKPSQVFSPEACSYSARSRSYAMSPEKSNLEQADELPLLLWT